MLGADMKPEDYSKYLYGDVNLQFWTTLKGEPVHLIIGEFIIYIHPIIFS